MKHLAILGASGHGKVVADAAEAAGWQSIVFFDDAWPELGSNGRWDVIGGTCELVDGLKRFDGVVIGIGNNDIRQQKLVELADHGAPIVSIIHPRATVSPSAKIGAGSVLFAGSVVNADAVVGSGSIINTNAVIEHDCNVGLCCHVSPNGVLAGGVELGDLVWVGAGACMKQLLSAGPGALIGMGAVVTKDVPPGATVVGNPARPLAR